MQDSSIRLPRLVIAGLRGGAGKTILSVGLIAAWRSAGRAVAPFKKGPDYIDAGWLALAANQPCFNLDPFLVSREAILDSVARHSDTAGLALIEGNRGLYDGIDPQGATSTAELAKILAAPVVICLDCTKTTRTMAAVVRGLQSFDSDVFIAGVILNRIAGARHEAILRASLQHYCGIPILGAVPRLRDRDFPERHMGLVPTHEHAWARDAVASAGEMARRYLDLEALAVIAAAAPLFPAIPSTEPEQVSSTETRVRIGVMRDSAFQFYYPENIEALERCGAEIVPVSPLAMRTLPDLDALYIGGGFPETHAAALTDNRSFREQLRSLALEGFPIYAECGGLMYLGEELVLEEGRFPMAGVLPVSFGFSRRPQGHGYTVVRVVSANPYFPVGTCLRGHEFHYSKVIRWQGQQNELAFAMERGAGMVEGFDGVYRGNVLATYTHLHALGSPQWAPSLVMQARRWRQRSSPHA